MQPEPAFVLHTRPYRETSLLVDFFTRNYGRFRAVARGARAAKIGTKKLNPYTQLLIGWAGKTELKTLTHVEQSSSPLTLKGDCLFCGFYLNEILIRLLAENDPHEEIYDNYAHVLAQLAGNEPIEHSLRTFEFSLLEELGYALVLDADTQTGEKISPEKEYWFEPNIGFSLKEGIYSKGASANLFKGGELLAFKNHDFNAIPLTAKRLMRLALEPHIGEKPLLSRNLFSKLKATNTELIN